VTDSDTGSDSATKSEVVTEEIAETPKKDEIPLTEVATEAVAVTEVESKITTQQTQDVPIDFNKGFDVKAANLVMDTYIHEMKIDSDADKLYLLDFKPYVHNRWGKKIILVKILDFILLIKNWY
jgi:hypothetical protein